MSDYQFIKKFQEIKISKMCEDRGIDLSNLLSGKTTVENYVKIKNDIIKELLSLLMLYKGDELLLIGLYNEYLEKQEKENRMLREMI